jgi:hypothetical protein
MSLTKSLPGRKLLKITVVPARESLVSDIPAGDGKNDNLFYSVERRGGGGGVRGKTGTSLRIFSCILKKAWVGTRLYLFFTDIQYALSLFEA